MSVISTMLPCNACSDEQGNTSSINDISLRLLRYTTATIQGRHIIYILLGYTAMLHTGKGDVLEHRPGWSHTRDKMGFTQTQWRRDSTQRHTGTPKTNIHIQRSNVSKYWALHYLSSVTYHELRYSNTLGCTGRSMYQVICHALLESVVWDWPSCCPVLEAAPTDEDPSSTPSACNFDFSGDPSASDFTSAAPKSHITHCHTSHTVTHTHTSHITHCHTYTHRYRYILHLYPQISSLKQNPSTMEQTADQAYISPQSWAIYWHLFS